MFVTYPWTKLILTLIFFVKFFPLFLLLSASFSSLLGTLSVNCKKGEAWPEFVHTPAIRRNCRGGTGDQRNATNDIILSSVAIMPRKIYGKSAKKQDAIFYQQKLRFEEDDIVKRYLIPDECRSHGGKGCIWQNIEFRNMNPLAARIWQNWWILLHQKFHKVDPNITKSACYAVKTSNADRNFRFDISSHREISDLIFCLGS